MQFGCDVPGAVWTGPELRHCSQVALLERREPIEPYSKETRVKRRDRSDRCSFDIGERDRRSLGNVPSMLTPLLQEIGVALRLLDHQGDRGGLDTCLFV